MTNKLIFLSVFVLLALNIKAQRLTLDDLIVVQKADLAELTAFLGNKGWEFHASKLPADNSYGEISFAHSKQEYEEKAAAWIHILFDDSLSTRVLYQTASREVYQAFQNKVAAYGMEEDSQTVANGSISTAYTGKNYALIVTHTTTDDYNRPVYVFSLWEKRDYLIDKLLQSLKENK